MTKEKIKELLEEKAKGDDIMAEVAQDAIEQEDALTYLQDVQSHGCQSGAVSGLIYYTDTHAFYDRHYEEIEEMREEYEGSIGEPLKINGDLKNWFAWFAYEGRVNDLIEEIENN